MGMATHHMKISAPKLAAIAAAMILWFARNPVLATLFGDDWAEDPDAEYDAEEDYD